MGGWVMSWKWGNPKFAMTFDGWFTVFAQVTLLYESHIVDSGGKWKACGDKRDHIY
jgi:hypothetical protein